MSVETLRRLFSPEEYNSAYYIKFRPFTNIQAEKLKIAESLGITPDSIGRKCPSSAAMGQSDDPFSWRNLRNGRGSFPFRPSSLRC